MWKQARPSIHKNSLLLRIAKTRLDMSTLLTLLTLLRFRKGQCVVLFCSVLTHTHTHNCVCCSPRACIPITASEGPSWQSPAAWSGPCPQPRWCHVGDVGRRARSVTGRLSTRVCDECLHTHSVSISLPRRDHTPALLDHPLPHCNGSRPPPSPPPFRNRDPLAWAHPHGC